MHSSSRQKLSPQLSSLSFLFRPLDQAILGSVLFLTELNTCNPFLQLVFTLTVALNACT
jgi:hypothetical protein